MKTPEEIKKVKDDPTCFECNHYEVCQMWSNAGYLHKDNPKKCSHFAGRSSERRKISTLQTIVDEQDKVIQQLEAQVPRWISVEERLPGIKGSWPYCQHVTVLTKNKEVLPGLFNGNLWYVMRDEDAYCTRAYDGEVTHWMPRIEPPEEE